MLTLLAQAANNNNRNDLPPEEILLIVLVVLAAVLSVWLVIRFFFSRTLYLAMSRCHPRNRTMEPGLMWLNMVPVLHLVWQFITVNHVGNSLRNEFDDRNWARRQDDYGHGIGIAFCVLSVVAVIPYIGGCFGLAGFVCFILYWVRIANYSAQIARRFDDPDDRDDDRALEEDDRAPDRRRNEFDDGLDERPWERR